VVAACGGGAGAPAPFEQSSDLASKLEAATGVKWHALSDAEGLRVLAPEGPVRLGAGTAEEQATEFLRTFGAELGFGPGEATVRARSIETDGVEYLRVEQTLPGSNVPIFDAATTMSFDSGGRVEVILPSFRADASTVATAPAITAAAAETIARKAWVGQCEQSSSDVRATEPALGAVVHGASLRLAYRVEVAGVGVDCPPDRYDVDAGTGAILSARGTQGIRDTAGGVRFARGLDSNDTKSFEVPETLGVRSMVSAHPTVHCSTYGSFGIPIVSTVPGSWDDGKGAAVDAYFHVVEALRFFKEGLGRNGIDGQGLGVRVIVHDNSARNSNGFNACFRGERPPLWPLLKMSGARLAPEIHIGDGGKAWLPLSAAYDVLAHELGHGIIGYSSKLVYAGESGALDEAFADVIGASAKEWSRLPGHPASLTIGEKMMAYATTPPLRNMENPPAAGDPDHTTKMQRCAPGEEPDQQKNDNCYVHSNSGIGNKAFALMVKGGSHYGFAVPTALGWERSRTIWYRAMTQLGSSATFLQAAEAQMNEARRIGPNAFLATACAWIAVGVVPETRIVNARGVCRETIELGKAPATEGCNGIENGYACNASAPYSAYVCKGGSIAGGINCADTSKRCRRASATDPRATVDTNGLVCD
jgi:thermolysin